MGRVVPLHQGRGRGHPPGGDDRAPRPVRRCAPRRLPGLANGRRPGSGGGTGRVAPVPGARRDQRGDPDDARRLGRDAHRLEHRRHRTGVGADLRRAARAAVPATRAAREDARSRARSRARRRRAAHGCASRRRLVGGRGNARGRALVAQLRGRGRLRPAPRCTAHRARCSRPARCWPQRSCSCPFAHRRPSDAGAGRHRDRRPRRAHPPADGHRASSCSSASCAYTAAGSCRSSRT